ncbi:TolC family protein [Flavobacterium sp.]|uniref:TolC family protein n=1 Tax=Flavobacterium sp. TaxID=239 RepID=UPI00352701FE
MFVKKITLLFLAITITGWAQTKKWTLEDCVYYALENNVSVKQSLLDWENAKIDKTLALGNFLPSLSGSASYNINTGANINPTTNQFENSTFKSMSGNVNSGITLFNGLSNWKSLQRAKLSNLAASYSLAKMKDDIALNVANSFLEILVQKEQIKLVENQLKITKENKKRTTDLIEAGQLPAGDLYEIDATLASQEQQLIAAKNNEAFAKIALAQLLLLEDYVNFDIAEQEFAPEFSQVFAQTPNAIYQKAKDVVNDVKVAQSNYEISKTDEQLAKTRYLPTLSGFVGYSTRWSESNPLDFVDQLYLLDGTAIGLQLNVPILNGFSTRMSVKRAKINAEKSELLVKQTELDLERNVYQAYNNAVAAQKNYDANLKTVNARKMSYQFSQERYNVGLMNSFDYMQSQLNYENAQNDLIRAKYDYIFKTKILEYYFGIPITQKN